MKTNEAIDAALAAIPGLTFGDCVSYFARQDASDLNSAIIEAARDQHEREGECEIDDLTLVSGGDDPTGDYVLAWVWAKFDKSTITEPEDEEVEG